MSFPDLRSFIEKNESLGQLQSIEDADWNLEIGAITEVAALTDRSPVLLFDKIKGYPTGYRVVTNLYATEARQALALGLPTEAHGIELVKAWRERSKRIRSIASIEVSDGPIKENVVASGDVNVLRFPAPKWHELDGGRYIGTGCLVITRDIETGWVNLGVYRIQVHDEKTLGFGSFPGHHGEIMARKYFDAGKRCPIAIICGQDPATYAAACNPVPWGVSEYDYAGGLRGEPSRVIIDDITALPIPATAEIALLGEVLPPTEETRLEGPFGEFTGYYAEQGPLPVIKVRAIYHRHNPILQGNPTLKPPAIGHSLGAHITTSAAIWDALDREIPDVRGVWVMPEASASRSVVMAISIKQRYPGHAKQAALVATACHAGALMNRFVIVVDDDIDPANLQDVIWALAYRCDPASSIDIIREGWAYPIDPLISPAKKAGGDYTNSRAILIACKPFSWKEKFPPTNKASEELRRQVIYKWGRMLGISDARSGA